MKPQEKEVVEKMFNALLQAEAALEMLGGKKKHPTDFVPCEVLAYRIVNNAIELAFRELPEMLNEAIPKAGSARQKNF